MDKIQVAVESEGDTVVELGFDVCEQIGRKHHIGLAKSW